MENKQHFYLFIAGVGVALTLRVLRFKQRKVCPLALRVV